MQQHDSTSVVKKESPTLISEKQQQLSPTFINACKYTHIYMCMRWYRGSGCMELLPADHAAALGDLLGEVWDGRCTAALQSRWRVNIMRDMFMLERGREGKGDDMPGVLCGQRKTGRTRLMCA